MKWGKAMTTTTQKNSEYYKSSYFTLIKYFVDSLYKKELEYLHANYNREETIKQYTELFNLDIATKIANDYEDIAMEDTHDYCEYCDTWFRNDLEHSYDGIDCCEKCYDKKVRQEERDYRDDPEADYWDEVIDKMKRGDE